MKKILLLFLLFVFLFGFSYSQNPLVKMWDKRFGGTGGDILWSFQQTADGGYILGGLSNSGIGGDKTLPSQGGDYWIVKTDSLGNKLWDKTFGGTDMDDLLCLWQTSDGGYIFGGQSYSGIGGDKTQPSQGAWDYWVVKTDSLGNKQWDKTFGGTYIDALLSIQQTRDGGYILGGWSSSGIGGDKTFPSKGREDYWIIKTDSLGNKQWDKDLGGTNGEVFNSLQQTADGGYILGGHSNSGISGDKTQASRGRADYWIIKIDSLGNKQWDKDFGGTYDDVLYSLKQTPDGGYILGGWSLSGISGDKTQPSKGLADYWIVKTDSLGNKQWDKDFGGSYDENDFGNIFQTTDGGYIIAGTSYSQISGDKSENNLGSEQSWIVKTDSLGNKQWDKTLFTTGNDGIGYGMQTKDECYAFANFTDGGVGGYKTQTGQGSWDFWVIKFCDSTMAVLPISNYISSDSVFCAEGSNCINFFDQSYNNPTSWKWLFPGAVPAFSNQQNPINICYSIPGTYPVTLIVTNAAGSDTLTVSPMITVGQTPSAPTLLVFGDTIICSHASSYQWYFNGNIIPVATDSFYIAPQPGNYSVQITDSVGCSRFSSGVITDASPPTPLQGRGVFGVYPNPVNGSFVVSFSSIKNTVAGIDIVNVLGEIVYRKEFSVLAGNNSLSFGEGWGEAGVYVVQLIAGDKVYRTKFIKD